MVSESFYIKTVLRILLIALTLLIFFALLFYFPNISLLTISAALAIVQIVLLIRYLMIVYRRIDLFFINYISGELSAGYGKTGEKDEFTGLYRYFKLIGERLEKTRVESEIRNNYFKTIVDHTSVGLISFTPDGKVELFNDAAKKIFGFYVLRELSKLDQIRAGLSEMLIKMEPQEQQLISFVAGNEMVQLTVRKSAFTAGGKVLYLISFQNIISELEQQEIESWQKLVRVLTHEIMNSMTPIISIAATLGNIFKKKITEQSLEKAMVCLETIEGRSQGLVHFVQNYRDVTLLPKPVYQDLKVKDLFMHIKGFYEDEMERRGISLSVQCNPLIQMRADGKLLQQVMINLVKNAMEALDGRPNPEIILTAQSAGERTVIDVTDNGWGIASDALEQIFVPFFTTKEKGSGIGLSLSKQIVRIHGGSLTVHSVKGEGTTFTIRI